MRACEANHKQPVNGVSGGRVSIDAGDEAHAAKMQVALIAHNASLPIGKRLQRAVLGMPAGKRLAPMLDELVAVTRHFGELVIDEPTAALLVSMSAATIDRRLAGERAKYQLKGRASTKPGSLLKSQIPVRTWADWDDARPGFVEIDLVCHDGGNPAGPHTFTLTLTDIATGWTENRSVPDKTAKCVLAALDDIAYKMPFPILGVDSDTGSEFINVHLLQWGQRHQITFTRARPANKNDGCHVEQKNWAWSAPWSATTATTPPQSCCYSTRSGSCSPS